MPKKKTTLYILNIKKEPGALFISVTRTADGVEMWRGRCHPNEKEKTIEEAITEVSQGRSLTDLLRDKHQRGSLDAVEDLLQGETRNDLVGQIRALAFGDFQIVDETEGS